MNRAGTGHSPAHSNIHVPIGKGGEGMQIDFNSLLLLVIAVELGLIYLKMGRK